jgi:hypothetical protein
MNTLIEQEEDWNDEPEFRFEDDKRTFDEQVELLAFGVYLAEIEDEEYQ